MSAQALVIDDLRGGYGSVDVLHGISLNVGPTERVGMFGPNGHGKTTLLNAISGLVRKTAGSVTFLGERITNHKAENIVAMGLVLVPQGNTLFPDMAVMEILELSAYTRAARAHRKENLEHVLTLFPRLAERRKQDCKTLSGGERQMLAIGVGLMANPKMLMLDEPTLGLSPKLKLELGGALAEISQSKIPVLLVEQDVEFVMTLVDRLYMVDHGEVVREFEQKAGLDHDEIMQMYFGGAVNDA